MCYHNNYESSDIPTDVFENISNSVKQEKLQPLTDTLQV